MYRCGFSDWLDGIGDGDFACQSCGEDIDGEYVTNNACMEDEILCEECRKEQEA